jgi:hypothetical protein
MKLVFHLFETFIVILLENLPLFVLKVHIVIHVLQKEIQLLLGLSLKPRKVLVLLDPLVSMKGQLVLLLDVLRMILDCLELRQKEVTL